MKFRYLLAKSTADSLHPHYAETLVGHTESVLQAALALFDCLKRDLDALLGDDLHTDIFRDALIWAALIHDMGKANDHFQKMIRALDKRVARQGVRHETLGFVISAHYILPYLEVVKENGGHPLWFPTAVLFAAAGHHLKFPDPVKDRKGDVEVTFLGAHPDIQRLFTLAESHAGLQINPRMENKTYSLLMFGGVHAEVHSRIRELDHGFPGSVKKLIALLKSSLICADIAGSALPDRRGVNEISIRKWLTHRLSPTLTRRELQNVVDKRLKGQTPRPFQIDVCNAPTQTVVLEAGCGAGKTAAAYLWSAVNAENKRLFFCYPTTATAAEGFAGYLQDPDFEAILVNSRAEVDYRLLTNLPQRAKSQLEFRQMQLEALETWPIPAVVCTAHTVLGLLQNTRRGICAFPSIARSVFVFDEVHAYSPKLFRHLLRFLEIFRDRPVLMMTATLPPDRKTALADVCRTRGGATRVKGPEVREKAPRYSLSRSEEFEAWEKVQFILNDGGKVLWICNTVSRAMDQYESALELGLPARLFHSRFRYRDRLQRQRSLIDGFFDENAPMLAVTTQVAEMSLDLSSDLLITEYAPIAALIQRLGRLNRFEEIPDLIKMALFLEPPNALPYAKAPAEEAAFFERINQWLDAVADGTPKSQHDLAEIFASLEVPVFNEDDHLTCDWIDEPAMSLKDRHSLMETGFTVDVVREEDLGSGRLDEMVIPMPFPKAGGWESWPHRGRYLIAPAGKIAYDEQKGGQYVEGQPEAWII